MAKIRPFQFFLITTLLVIALGPSSFAQCPCTFTIAAGAGTINFDGVQKGVKPGDVICLETGLRERINFSNITGTPANPVKITNCGGQALVGGPSANQAISFTRSRYFHVTGTGAAGIPYGIKIVESKPGSQGIQVSDLSSDAEMDHVEITKTGFAGIMLKSDPSKDCSVSIFERPYFTMHNIVIHDNFIHDIGGEGIYCGNSYFTGATAYCPTRVQYPHEVRGVKIYNNRFENCAWESIQVGAAVEGVEIHHNQVYNYGSANVAQQNGGIQIGVGSTGRVYNNFIKNGTGVALLIQGIGNTYVYNNVIVNSGTFAMVFTLRPTPLITDIVPQTFVAPLFIINNTIITTKGANVKESVVGAIGNVMYNNLVVGGSSPWNDLRRDTDWKQKNNLYFKTLEEAKVVNPNVDDYRLVSGSPAINAGMDVSGFDITNDFDNRARPFDSKMDVGAFEFGANQKPLVTAADHAVSLPTVTVNLSGSAMDPDGTIVSYRWTKQSGATATIASPATPVSAVTGIAPGVYVFRLTATDNQGATGFKDVKVTVTDPSVNRPPVATAGGNKAITLPTVNAVLTGSASDPDGRVVSYQWTKLSAAPATMTNAATPVLTLIGLAPGAHTFRLTVTDDDGEKDTDDATVTVQPAGSNQSPYANAGQDKNIALPTNSINLVGLGMDPDGSIAAYSWTKISGGNATLTNAQTATLQLSGLQPGFYVFGLTVTDNKGAISSDETTVNVAGGNQAPIANAGGPAILRLPTSTTTLSGSASDADGTITGYVWTKVNGPAAVLANATTPSLSLSGLVLGVYVFRLTVTDNNLATASDEMTLTVQNNAAPTVDAGAAKTLVLPVSNIILTGSATDNDGTIASYLWEKVSGPTTTLNVVNTASLALTGLIEGSYLFRLTATDNNGATGTDDVSVVVFPPSTNQSPLLEAGENLTLTLPANTAALTATASDPDGTISSYLWEQISGAEATLNGVATATLSLTNLIQGTYLFRVTVMDNKGSTVSDDISVTVSTQNQPPRVSTGSNQIVVLPKTFTSVTAVATDPDGTVASYLWSRVSGPPGAVTSGANTNTFSVSNLITGIYIFRVTVTDNNGATAADDINISVQSATNINPVVTVESSKTVYLPTNTVNLSGQASDSDGTIASYLWTKVSGPPVDLSNTTTTTLTASNLVTGTYLFRLTATDNNGGSGIGDVTISVKVETANQPPVANAGPAIALSLPVNSTNLIGSGSDPDGNIAKYTWIKVSGPSATLSNPTTAVLSLVDLVEGIYIFRLTVTDNAGAAAANDTQVTVLPASVNQAPYVIMDDARLTLPSNVVNLLALAGDADGSIVSYRWTKQVGPTATITGESLATLSLSNLVQGNYVFRVVVTDNKGATSFAESKVVVQPEGTNQPPVANAGPDQQMYLPPVILVLNGSGSDADGFINSYNWTKISGPTATLTNANTPVVTLSALVAGQYIFRLSITDDTGAVASDQVTITILQRNINQPPIANAGTNQTIAASNSTTWLSGSGFDPDGSIVAYLWSQKSGPPCTLENTDSPTLIVNDITAGVYQFEITVRDDKGATGTDIALITAVESGLDLTPIADAGFDQVIQLPLNTVQLQGAGTDPDGLITSYAWNIKSGPSAFTMLGQTTSRLSLSGLVVGNYQFTLTVTDSAGLYNSDNVRVTVMPATVNGNPTVNAGTDVFIRLPETSVTLAATASDNDGTIVSYHWIQQSGSEVAFSNVNSAIVELNDLGLGVYEFSVEVTDDDGSIATDEVTVTVAEEGTNQPPVVVAGAKKVISMEETAVVLNGSASDVDGSVVSLAWSQQDGPQPATLSGASSATLSIHDLVLGTYTFRLTATDNENLVAFDETTVEVKEELTPPTVFAGNDTTLLLPNNLITLTGVATPGDDHIREYEWTQTDGAPVLMEGEYPEIVVGQLFPGIYEFSLRVADSRGVEATDDIIVTVVDSKSNPIGAALVFTPNGDATNDVWMIKNINMIQGCPVAIFNSLGMKVFESDEYLNDWNGSSNGQQMKEGDYYFVFQCSDKKKYSGAFRLVR